MPRRRRRPKTDSIDGKTLLRTLMAFRRGEPRVRAMAKPPSVEEEDRRRLGRERKTLVAERIRHINRIKGLLFTQGIVDYQPLRRDRRARLEALRTGLGDPLPSRLKGLISRELDRLELPLAQIKAVEAEREALLAEQSRQAPAAAPMLLAFKGIGPEFATVLWLEGLFRSFANRRQVAAYAGLAPTPWRSGSIEREQGASKAGNPRLRATLIELAWLWRRHQPNSALTLWFEDRVKANGGRVKKALIVALARKLLVALWKYVTTRPRHRGGCDRRPPEPALSQILPQSPPSSRTRYPSWRIQANEPSSSMDLKTRSSDWSRSPEPAPPKANHGAAVPNGDRM